MSSTNKGLLLGALFGLAMPLGLTALQVHSPTALGIFWPFASLGIGVWGTDVWIARLLLDTIAFGSNALLYGSIGALIGKLLALGHHTPRANGPTT